ncbi:protein IQ-DOMAIN 14-like isoform X1 [Cucurbita moschata]|uniref:Protein IQ-DOMAIN 14-like isoform X1 n=1 Tax=Cucurbita moschata TaxID=3662 RepID=A0A6J1G2I3_CUCMO|nr:protein IQ-DOMAIN 14-like isoform X1 [Cucurbita moschata]
MGKAAKWILNLLLGKKEGHQKNQMKKKMGSSSFSDHSANLKLKWSFRKTNLLLTHKLSKSDGSIGTIESLKHVAMADQKKPPSSARNAAATTIQSAYRSHLARKALHALRALVKIQALVRGYLVRKQTAATLKSLQALMAIQVRARVSRIQLLEDEEELLERRQRKRLVDTNLKKVYYRLNMNLNETRRSYTSKSDHISRSQIEQIVNEPNACSCRRNLSIPRQYQHKDHSGTREPNMSKPTSETALFSMDHPRRSDFVPNDHPFYPNYMAKTKTSRAKVRSQSEPKQRPSSSAHQLKPRPS